MKHRIFSTSEKAWEAMQKAISDAKKSVYLEMYIVSDDTSGNDFLYELEKAAKRGVKVIAILDIVGSFRFRGEVISQLREAGAEVLFCSFFFQRMHRKVLIVDETFAYVGGVNVGKNYARWKDLQIEVKGAVVDTVLRSFARAYRNCGGKGSLAAIPPRIGAMKKAKLWFIDHGIGKRRELFRKHYEERFRNAKESIIFVTPYLLPPRWFLAELHQASIRGVTIEVLLPLYTDYRIVDGVNRSFASFLTSIGARCYFTPWMNHAKAMIVDSREGTIGSQNLDMLSFNWNIEAGVFFHEPTMVRDLTSIIEGWKKEAVLSDANESTLRWYDFPTAFLLRLFGFLPLM